MAQLPRGEAGAPANRARTCGVQLGGARTEGAWMAKVNLQIRETNAGAVVPYRRHRYSADDDISMGRRLVDDERSSS